MSLPFVYTPRPGEYIRVSRDGDNHCLIATCGSERGSAVTVRILPDEVPGVAAGITAGMHEAAGLPSPVILERPVLPGLMRYAGVCKVFADGAAVRLQATERVTDGRAYWFTRLAPETARELAASLAAMAGAVEAEPDPAEVEELRSLVAGHIGGSGTADDIARAALRWFRDKQHRGGAS